MFTRDTLWNTLSSTPRTHHTQPGGRVHRFRHQLNVNNNGNNNNREPHASLSQWSPQIGNWNEFLLFVIGRQIVIYVEQTNLNFPFFLSSSSIFIFPDTVLYIYIDSWTIHWRLLSMCNLRILHGRVAGTILHHIYISVYVHHPIGDTVDHIHFNI